MSILCDNDSQNVLIDSPNPILVYGPTGFLKFANPSFEKLTGFKVNEMIGTEPPFPWWGTDGDDLKLYSLAFKIGLSKGSKHKAIKFKTLWGECFYVDINTSRLNGNQQAVQNWFDVTDEVTARQKIETLLRGATLRMEALQV